MAEVTRVYQQNMPSVRFVGRKYSAAAGGYGDLWGEWFERGWFEPLERMHETFRAGTEDDDAYVGLMRHGPCAPFEYWIGMFLSADADVPGGYQFIDFEPFELSVAWLRGPESEIYAQEEKATQEMAKQGIQPAADGTGAYWFMERYACPRFTQTDENGCVTLDICLISGWNRAAD